MLASNGPQSASFRIMLISLGVMGALYVPGGALAQSAPATPDGLLKWSMGKYGAMTTFQTECKWSTLMNGVSGGDAVRSIQYAKPNRFKIVSTTKASNMTQTSVSDGKKTVEFMSGGAIPAQSYTAPDSLANARTMFIGNPMFCGSVFYKFFGGPGSYSALVNEAKRPVRFGPDVTLEGLPCKTVTFWAQGLYGTTEVVIDPKTGFVHQIRYRSEPLMEQMQKMLNSPEFQAQMKKSSGGANLKALTKNMPTSQQATEKFENIVVGKEIAPAVFTANAPAGQQTMQAGGGSEPKPPVPLGKPAPEVSLTGIDGVKKKLSDFRGRVVLLDFWATWCPPCRKGLPETQKFFAQYAKKGLAVLTISDEARPTVTAFLKQNRYTFPAYLDKGGATNKAYGIAAIPTTAIIDRNGHLAAYMVGLAPPEDILAALKKAGLDTK